MKYLTSALAAGLLLFGTSVSAQYRPRDDRYDEQRRIDRVFDHLREDLDRVATVPLPFTADHTRIMQARQDLNRAERTIENGTYDLRDINAAVVSVQNVVDQNHLLTDTNRDNLANDLSDLRVLRERIEDQR